MPERQIVLYPDIRLKTRCDAVAASRMKDAVAILDDLMDTIASAPPRTVGIAAPQIGEMYRVAVVDASRNPKYHPGNGLLRLINPMIVHSEGIQIFREGCLSLPEFTANVSRPMQLIVRAIDASGNEYEVASEGFEAVVLQHEIDHLDGILFLDHVKNLKSDLFRRK